MVEATTESVDLETALAGMEQQLESVMKVIDELQAGQKKIQQTQKKQGEQLEEEAQKEELMKKITSTEGSLTGMDTAIKTLINAIDEKTKNLSKK